MTLRIHRLENNEYWKDRSSPQTSDTISPIRGPRPRPYEPVLAFRLAPLMAIAVRLGSSPHRRCHRRYRVVSGARATTAPAITTATTPAVSDSPTTSSPPEPTPTTSSPPTTEAPATTMTAAPAPTTTAAPTTTTLAPSQLIEDFVVLFALAIADGDADFLLNRLHPAVTGGFGPDLCLNWIETEILQLGDYELTGPVQGPQDRPFTTPAGTGTIEGAYSAPVSFVFQGQLFNAQGGFVLIGAEVNWLGQCR